MTPCLLCLCNFVLLQVENVALLANSKDVGYVGVNLYCDDQAIAKELPVNPRACQIAECCGKMVQVGAWKRTNIEQPLYSCPDFVAVLSGSKDVGSQAKVCLLCPSTSSSSLPSCQPACLFRSYK